MLIYQVVKFGLSEKHTKFEKIFLMVLTNQLIYLVNVKTMRKIFSNYVCFSKSPKFMQRQLKTHIAFSMFTILVINLWYDCDLPDVLEDSTWSTYGQYGPHRGPFCNA